MLTETVHTGYDAGDRGIWKQKRQEGQPSRHLEMEANGPCATHGVRGVPVRELRYAPDEEDVLRIRGSSADCSQRSNQEAHLAEGRGGRHGEVHGHSTAPRVSTPTVSARTPRASVNSDSAPSRNGRAERASRDGEPEAQRI